MPNPKETAVEVIGPDEATTLLRGVPAEYITPPPAPREF